MYNNFIHSYNNQERESSLKICDNYGFEPDNLEFELLR